MFEQYQKARTQFVQMVAELATRPQNIETLQNAGEPASHVLPACLSPCPAWLLPPLWACLICAVSNFPRPPTYHLTPNSCLISIPWGPPPSVRCTPAIRCTSDTEMLSLRVPCLLSFVCVGPRGEVGERETRGDISKFLLYNFSPGRGS